MDLASQRQQMVERQVAARGVKDERVLSAMREIPRERFVPESQQKHAYDDSALSIGRGQTISQPFIVALMIEALGLRPGDRVLEVGTGSGYAAAVMSRIASRVYGIERHAELADFASARVSALGYDNVQLKHGDGTLGWPEHAPFDAILVSAGGPEVSPALRDQLAVGGRLVMPVGSTRRDQELVRIVRAAEGEFEETSLGGVRFVPLIGEGGWPGEDGPAEGR